MRTVHFAPDMLELIKRGKKTLTSRRRRYGGIYEVKGPWFNPERLRVCVELIPVVNHKLDTNLIAVKYHRREGFNSPQEFLARLSKFYPQGVPTELWLHWVKIVQCWKVARPQKPKT